MKLYDSIGPNPHVVRMLAMKGENRQADHLGRNPAGQTPALEIGDGVYLSEITAICEYLEEKYPTPALIGATAEERAETRMWVRRFDENVIWPAVNGFRYAEGAPLFTGRIPVYPEIAPQLKALALDRQKWIDGMIRGRTYFCGDRFTLADVIAFCFLGFGAAVGQPINPAATNLLAWFERVKSRPSAAA